jgi:hypothetical protein
MRFKQFITESEDINVSDVVKIGKFKWEIFRKWGDYQFSAYKYNTAKRKLYIIEYDGNKWEVWEVNGMGEKIHNKPVVTGKLTMVKSSKPKKKTTNTKDNQMSSLPAGFEGF